jgi:phosphoglycerate dehydrogenase-like enzyme
MPDKMTIDPVPGDPVQVTSALPLSAELADRITAVSPRLTLLQLTRAQRLLYREGRPLWAGYHEPPAADDEDEDTAREGLASVLRDTQILLTNPIVPDNILDRAPALRLVQLTSAGVDRLIDSELVLSGRVVVTTASGLHAVPISEYVLGAMIAFAKGFPRALKAQDERQWRPFWPQELEGATVAVLGVGAIGRRVAVLCRALGMRVLGVRRSIPERVTGEDPDVDEMHPVASLKEVLAQSDYVVLALPLTEESRQMIGEAELSAMKPTAVVINIARGAVIDQAALTRALKEGVIGGAALDVTDPEPLPQDHELWSAPNLMITPHISGGTPRYMDRAIDIFCDNLRRYVQGEPLRNVVDPGRGY